MKRFAYGTGWVTAALLLVSPLGFAATTDQSASKKAERAPLELDTRAPDSSGQKKQGVIRQLSGQGYGTAGCGLGSILFGEDEGGVQIFASTTNGIYSHQTFAISSGTSNCDTYEGQSEAADRFFEANRVALENDAARGSGERLEAFARLLGCEKAGPVGQRLHDDYSKIFPINGSDSDAMDAIRSSLRSDEKVRHACPGLDLQTAAL